MLATKADSVNVIDLRVTMTQHVDGGAGSAVRNEMTAS